MAVSYQHDKGPLLFDHSEAQSSNFEAPCRTSVHPCRLVAGIVSVMLLWLSYLSIPTTTPSNSMVVSNRQHQGSMDLTLEGKQEICHQRHYTEKMLALEYEMKLAGLYSSYQQKYDASGVVVIGDGQSAYAVSPSSWEIYKFDLDLLPRAKENVRIQNDAEKGGGDSGYEAIVHDEDTFYMLREADEDSTARIVIEKAHVQEDGGYSIDQACPTPFGFRGDDSQGFQGAVAIRDLDDSLVILGLYRGYDEIRDEDYDHQKDKDETNRHQSDQEEDEDRHRVLGHNHKKRKDKNPELGRLVAMRLENTHTQHCHWSTIRTIEIPTSVDLSDYSAFALDPEGRVAIASQESSQLWVGRLLGKNSRGLWDVEHMLFEPNVGRIFYFPKDTICQKMYCLIAGIQWLDEGTILAVSGKMKGNQQQVFRCMHKDQSAHVFALPSTLPVTTFPTKSPISV
jgi:hypothetical protein